MKLIPALALVWLSSPIGLSKNPTIHMPIPAQVIPVKSSFLRPTWSTIADPLRAPIMEVHEFTRLSCRCLFLSVIPASPRRTGKKSDLLAPSHHAWADIHVIIPLPAS